MDDASLETGRLLLRALAREDLPALFAIQGDADAMRHTFCPATAEESARNLLGHERQRGADVSLNYTLLGLGDDRVRPFGRMRARGLLDAPGGL